MRETFLATATATLIGLAVVAAHADDARVTTFAIICPSKNSLEKAYGWIKVNDQMDILRDIHDLGCNILYGSEVVKIVEKGDEVSKIIWSKGTYFIQSKWLGSAIQPVIRDAGGTPSNLPISR
jgi:hypothetical protein